MTGTQNVPAGAPVPGPDAILPREDGSFPPSIPAVGRGITLVVWSILPIPFTILAVALRLWARRLNKKRLEFNDYMAVVACVFSVANAILTVLAVYLGGVGRHLVDILPYFPALMKIVLALAIIWTLANTAVKLSIVHLYIVIFRNKTFRLVSYGVIGLTAAYCVTNVLLNLLLCRPVEYNWDKTIPGGTCISAYIPYVSSAAINVLIDIIIIAMPLTMLWQLQMDTRRKISLTVIFGLGTLICVISAVRIHSIATLDFADFSYSVVPDGIYSVLEPCLGVINACLPVLQPVASKVSNSRLYSKLLRSSSKTKEYASFDHKNSAGFMTGSSSQLRTFGQRKANDGAISQNHTYMSVDSQHKDAIKVTSDWRVDSTRL